MVSSGGQGDGRKARLETDEDLGGLFPSWLDWLLNAFWEVKMDFGSAFMKVDSVEFSGMQETCAQVRGVAVVFLDAADDGNTPDKLRATASLRTGSRAQVARGLDLGDKALQAL